MTPTDLQRCSVCTLPVPPALDEQGEPIDYTGTVLCDHCAAREQALLDRDYQRAAFTPPPRE